MSSSETKIALMNLDILLSKASIVASLVLMAVFMVVSVWVSDRAVTVGFLFLSTHTAHVLVVQVLRSRIRRLLK